MPADVVDAAASAPLAADDTRRACADALHNSVHGGARTHRNTTLEDLRTQGESARRDAEAHTRALGDLAAAQRRAAADKAAFEAMKSRVPPPNSIELQNAFLQAIFSSDRLVLAQEASKTSYTTAMASYNASQVSYAAYRALPEEADAWDAGNRAAAAISAALVPPPSP